MHGRIDFTATSPKVKIMPNSGKMSPELYRGSQPEAFMSKEDETPTKVMTGVGHGHDGQRKNSTFSPGEVLVGRFRIVRLIDSGGMGDVYKAYDMNRRCTVALKRIKPALLLDAQFRRRVDLETEAAAVINQSGIVKSIYKHDDGHEMVFIVYEFVEGQTLFDLLGEQNFSLNEVLDIGIQSAKALIAAHAKGFIHRDLKPKNIMLVTQPDGSREVKILDFGLAKKVKVFSSTAQTAADGTSLLSITQSEAMFIGTPESMSPEQAFPKPVDFRTDIYSLGLVLYELATGFNPFAGRDAKSSRQRILEMPVPPLPQLAPGLPDYIQLDRILRKCLCKRPEERYQSAQELLSELLTLKGDRAPVSSQGNQYVPPVPIRRWIACVLFTAIQVCYLVMYAAAFSYLPEKANRLPEAIINFGAYRFVLITLAILCGAAAVRLYLLTAVAFDFEDLGRLFYRIFPGILILDIAWAVSPLLLFRKAGFVLLLGVVALVFLPFSQRTLVFSAYRRRGGRSSAAPAPGSGESLPASSPIPTSPWRSGGAGSGSSGR